MPPPKHPLGESVGPERKPLGQVHLAYIDGLRGLCALYIVLHHIGTEFGFPNAIVLALLRWGTFCVTVFITISGFCLMLPVARAGLTLRGGALGFYWRRVKRILPPYYAVLALVVVLWPTMTGGAASYRSMVHTAGLLDIGLHAALVHNWFAASSYTLNGPLWSVAAECQIYLLFPLLVLLWRKLGMYPMLLLTGLVSNGAAVLAGYRGPVYFVFIFALGMWAAERAWQRVQPRSVAWLALPAGLLLPSVATRHLLMSHLCVGLLAAVLLATCALEHHSRLRDWLSARWLRFLGSFSYSIYLVHQIPLNLAHVFLHLPRTLGPDATYSLLCGLLLPAVLGLAYIFYILVERPCISTGAKSARVEIALVQTMP